MMIRSACASAVFLGILAVLTGCSGPEKRPSLAFTPSALPEARVGDPYSVEIRAVNNRTPVIGYRLASGALPPGLEFQDAGDGARIAGTPREAGRFAFTIWASCYGTQVTGQSGQKSLEIRVLETK